MRLSFNADGRQTDIEIAGVTADSRAVAAGLPVRSAGRHRRRTARRFIADAVARGAVRDPRGRGRRADAADAVPVLRDRRSAPAPGAHRGRALSAPARDDRRRHRHQRQDLGRRLHAPDLCRARPQGRLARHHRPRQAGRRRLRLADDARSGRAAWTARRAGAGRRHASRHGGLLARPRPAAGSTACGSRPAPSPISATITSTITRRSEDYLAAKIRLFDTLLAPGQRAVVNADGAARGGGHRRLRRRAASSCSPSGERGETLKLAASCAMASAQQLESSHGGRSHDVRLPLLGGYQASNALVAAGLAMATGASAERRARRAARSERRQGAARDRRRGARRHRHRRLRPQARRARRGAGRAAPIRHRHASSACSAAAATATGGKRPIMGRDRGREGRRHHRHRRQPALPRRRRRSARASSPRRPGAREIGDRARGDPNGDRDARPGRRAAHRRQGPRDRADRRQRDACPSPTTRRSRGRLAETLRQ